LPEVARTDTGTTIEAQQEELADILTHAPQLEKEHRRRIEELRAAMAERFVSLRIKEVTVAFSDQSQISAYLEQIRLKMITNAELVLIAKAQNLNDPFPDAIRKYHQDTTLALGTFKTSCVKRISLRNNRP
jgi:hypothetical protein